jgi:5-methylcytosine-specific restriction endonuclease McrA
MVDVDSIIKFAELFSQAAKADRGEYMREYMAKRYHDKRNAMIGRLGGKCVSCGSTKGPFHLDHKDASKKTMRAADIHSTNDKKVQQEAKNFQLLCVNCHKDKTDKAWDRSVPKSEHGTYWRYKKHGCRCDKCTKAYKEKKKLWG